MITLRTIVIVWTAVLIREGMTADVQRPYIQPQDCPLMCTCDQYTVSCRGVRIFPEPLPKNTEVFKIAQSKISSVDANVFNDLTFLKRIEFNDSSVELIRACAFSELEQMDALLFQNVSIRTVEPNAFGNLASIQNITFHDCSVESMRSFAFHNISNIELIQFEKTNFTLIQAYAMEKLSDIDTFAFDSCHFDRFLGDAFSKFTNVAVRMRSVAIAEWQCGTLETILRSGKYELSGISLVCNCSHSWIWTHAAVSIVRQNDWIVCSNRNQTVRDITDVSTVCQDKSRLNNKCPHPLPSPAQFCERQFDGDFEADVDKVAYPKYFTRNPPNNGALGLCHSFLAMFLLLLF